MYRLYNSVVLGLIFLAVMSLLALGAWLEPLGSDLARLGGYPERYYGWNGLQYRFSPPLAEAATVGGRYDVVVFGDSFSGPTTPDRSRVGGYWTDYLAANIGLTVGVFNADWARLLQYTETEIFRTNPPKLLVLESIERSIDDLATPAPLSCPDLSREVILDGTALSSLSAIPHGSRRNTSFTPNFATIDMASDFLNKNIPRWLFGWDPTQVVRLPLSRADLFSDRESSHLLVFYRDLRKANWSSDDWTNIACRLRMIQARVEANGQTLFVAVIVPDKLSAYMPYLRDKLLQPSTFAKLAQVSGLNLPRLDFALDAAIAGGTKDVYLPDDTHWGTEGARIAACTIAEFLSRQNIRREGRPHIVFSFGSSGCDLLPPHGLSPE